MKFKVGDRVKVLRNNPSNSSFYKNDIFVITKIKMNHYIPGIQIYGRPPGREIIQFVLETDIKLITNNKSHLPDFL